MKILNSIFEYQTYSDYETSRSKWGSPEDLKDDAMISVKHATPTFDDKWVKSIEDQSDENKGIKFEVKLDKGDVIHMYKVGRWRSQWEFYLNKKKMTKEEIRAILQKKHLSPVEAFLLIAQGYDYYSAYIDNGGQWKNAESKNAEISLKFRDLKPADQKKVVKALIKKNPKNKENIERVFKVK